MKLRDLFARLTGKKDQDAPNDVQTKARAIDEGDPSLKLVSDDPKVDERD